jgi:hypothetical protein
MNGCELQMSSTTFVKMCKLPHQMPTKRRILYFNYKSFLSMNLLGVSDANCCFTLTDVGALGRENDSSVLVTKVLERRLFLAT